MPKPYEYTELELWEKLFFANSEEICKRALVNYSNQDYHINFLNLQLAINPSQQIIYQTNKIPIQDFELKLLVLYYLLNAKSIPTQNKWISEKQLKRGSLFFTNIHELPQKQIIDMVERDTNLFLKKANQFGGLLKDFGDISFQFNILPRIPIICIYWKRDEEFPASVQYLFDSTIESHFPLDVILAMVNVFVKIITDKLN